MKQAALQKLLRYTKQFIKLRTLGHLWNALEKIHYADIATLIENLSAQEQKIIIQLLLDRKLETSKFAEIISEIRPDVAVQLLSNLKLNQIDNLNFFLIKKISILSTLYILKKKYKKKIIMKKT